VRAHKPSTEVPSQLVVLFAGRLEHARLDTYQGGSTHTVIWGSGTGPHVAMHYRPQDILPLMEISCAACIGLLSSCTDRSSWLPYAEAYGSGQDSLWGQDRATLALFHDLTGWLAAETSVLQAMG
jgi:hypothetical protein